MLDRVVLVVLVIVDLLVASLTTYLPNLLLILSANLLLILGLRWLWQQYRHQTSPAEGQPAVNRRKPDIPWLVRLYLLPGMGRIVGTPAVRKARAIRFMRTDQWERGIPTQPAHADAGIGHRRMMLAIEPRSCWEANMHAWAARHPDECSTTVHLFDPGRRRCHCDRYTQDQLPLVRP